MGFPIPLINNLERNNLFNEWLMVHKSTFPKVLTLLFCLEIIHKSVFKLRKLDFGNEVRLEISMKLRQRCGSTRWFCQKCQSQPLSLKFACLRALKYDELILNYKNLSGSIIEDLQVDLTKSVNFLPWLLHIWVSIGISTIH